MIQMSFNVDAKTYLSMFFKSKNVDQCFSKPKEKNGLIDKVGVDYVDDLFRWLKLGSTNHLLSGVVDEVGDDKGRGNKEEGGPGQIFSWY